MRSILMPRRSHQTDSFERLNKPLGEAKGTPLSGADCPRQAALFEKPLKRRKCRLFGIGFHRLAQQQIARRMIGDGQRIAVAFVAEHELTLIVGAPQIIRTEAFR